MYISRFKGAERINPTIFQNIKYFNVFSATDGKIVINNNIGNLRLSLEYKDIPFIIYGEPKDHYVINHIYSDQPIYRYIFNKGKSLMTIRLRDDLDVDRINKRYSKITSILNTINIEDNINYNISEDIVDKLSNEALIEMNDDISFINSDGSIIIDCGYIGGVFINDSKIWITHDGLILPKGEQYYIQDNEMIESIERKLDRVKLLPYIEKEIVDEKVENIINKYSNNDQVLLSELYQLDVKQLTRLNNEVPHLMMKLITDGRLLPQITISDTLECYHCEQDYLPEDIVNYSIGKEDLYLCLDCAKGLCV
ncbi:MAG: hypothetical protein LC101_00480 [Flavobacteriales bacterium]|nr:hypothetical protein [Flavobacteriales bacterium]